MADDSLKALRQLVADGYVKPNADQKEILRLAEQRDDLIDAAELALGWISGGMDGNWDDKRDPVHILSAAIAKATV